MKIELSENSKFEAANLPPSIKPGIKQVIKSLQDDPFLGKPLSDELLGFRSLRFKRYRIIYKVEEEKHLVIVYMIGHRSKVYQNLIDQLKNRPKTN